MVLSSEFVADKEHSAHLKDVTDRLKSRHKAGQKFTMPVVYAAFGLLCLAGDFSSNNWKRIAEFIDKGNLVIIID